MKIWFATPTCLMKDYPEGAELIIRICLGRNDLHVIRINIQESLDPDNPTGKEGILDVWARDDSGAVYNIEVQYDSRDASPKRAFHYLSLMAQYELPKGAKYDARPNCYVIFITKTDYFGENKPYYWLSGFRQDGKDAGIGAYIIYINGAWKAEDDIGYLVKDMAQSNPEKMHYSVISQRAAFLKQPKEEVKMSGSLAYLKEKWQNEELNEAIYHHVHKMVSRLNMTVAECLDVLEISKEEYENACQAVEQSQKKS